MIARERWRRLVEQAERQKLEIKVTFKGEVMFHEKGYADIVIGLFRIFLRNHPEILPLTCSGKIHLHPESHEPIGYRTLGDLEKERVRARRTRITSSRS